MSARDRPSPPARDARRLLWFLCMMAPLIACAYMVHRVFIRRPRPTPRELAVRLNAAMTTTTVPASGPAGPVALVREAASAVTPLSDDPGGIAPPPGSVRVRAYQRQVLGYVEQHARYEVAGGGAAEHYRSVLVGKAFVLIQDRTRGGRRVLVFSRSGQKVVVAMPAAKLPRQPVTVTVLTGAVSNRARPDSR